MRNAQVAWISRIIAIALIWSAGCVDNAAKKRLDQGANALNEHRYDEAGAAANDYLAKYPNGPEAARALYIQGQAYELRAAESKEQTAAARSDLESAKTAYTRGLTLRAPADVSAHLHSGLANVAYFEEDYGTALREWQTAYANFKNDDSGPWILYRIGLCQQRLGWFPQADHTFNDVRQQYPGSEAAGRAATRIGAKAFYVQVGAFNDNANAQKLAQSLAQQGLSAGVAVDAGGRYAVRVGPAATYADAKMLRNRVAGQYPGAVILP